MAFETGTATGPSDLITKLFTFLNAQGWTTVRAIGASRGAIERVANSASPEGVDTVNIKAGIWFDSDSIVLTGFRDNPSPQTGAFQNYPGASQTDDDDTAAPGSLCIINDIAGPYTSYWFFEDDYYCHVVFEIAGVKHIHFTMCQVQKVGQWVGGEYYATTYWEDPTDPSDADNHFPYDGKETSDATGAGVMYARGVGGVALSDAPSSATKWYCNLAGDVDDNTGTDGDGDIRGAIDVQGLRGGLYFPLVQVGTSNFNGGSPLFPIPVMRVDGSRTPNGWRLMGYVPNVAYCNIANIAPNEVQNIGGDDWYFFPVGLRSASAGNFSTRFAGYAYKRT
jgi:hypothetical protein